PEQQRYNQAHIHTRDVVEHVFSVWKSGFQCFRNTLRFQQRRCCIQCFTITSNMAAQINYLKHGCPDPRIEDDPDVPMVEADNDRNGQNYRDDFAMQHFSQQR
ncbi:unnamed protein product, partial [Coregonus sp. 'balchen']